jgi:hypothetical protein
MTRLILAFISAAFFVPTITLFTSDGYFRLQGFALIAIFTVPLTVIGAAPLYVVFRKSITIWLCMVAGFSLGLVGSLIFLLMTNPKAYLNWLPAFLFAGWSSSVVFWLVGIWRNRNLTFNSTVIPTDERQ